MDVFLYNPRSQRDKGTKIMNKIIKKWEFPYVLYNVLEIDKVALFDTLNADDRIIMIGGDGTLHHLVNDIKDYNLKQNVYLIKGGTGNDFRKSLDVPKGLVNITPYIKNLPKIENDVFINGCGLGLDGYVCHLVNNSKKKGRLTFFRLTLKAFHQYEPIDAVITVDGCKHSFKKVYLVSVMNGSYEGGGMKMSPNSIRLDNHLEICVVYGLSKLALFFSFPLIYLGKHTIKKNAVKILEGKEITLEFKEGAHLQIDGEDFAKKKQITITR